MSLLLGTYPSLGTPSAPPRHPERDGGANAADASTHPSLSLPFPPPVDADPDPPPPPPPPSLRRRGLGAGASLPASVLRSAPSTSTTYPGGSTLVSTFRTLASLYPPSLSRYNTASSSRCGAPPLPHCGSHRLPSGSDVRGDGGSMEGER